MKSGLAFLGIWLLGNALGIAELGKSLTDLKILKNLTVVREPRRGPKRFGGNSLEIYPTEKRKRRIS
jgi:hypothetical protein